MALVDKTPYEAWVGENTSLTNLRDFGCDGFVHIQKEKKNLTTSQRNAYSLCKRMDW